MSLQGVSDKRALRIAADIGGTFTDIAAFDEVTGELRLGKTLTTPHKLVDGIITGVRKAKAEFGDASIFLHGSTIAINTLLERSGAKAALITTEGFRDVYEIGRINRPDAYNLFFQKHDPLIERALRFEVSERVLADGTVHIPLDRDQVSILADHLNELGVEAIAIMFLHCYRNADHEREVKQLLEQRYPHLFVSASHELSQEYREFERCSTVVANSYIGPRVRRYLSEMEEHLKANGFGGSLLIVQSTGGLYDVAQARTQCVRMLESGPAAGVIGTRALCHELDIPHAIAFDMGGTTAKAGVIYNGDVLTTGAALIGGYERALPVQIAMIDIFEVSAGGGSIARLDETGALRVGPQSAGADPGPACYALGGREPTITDANVVLGRLGPDRFLGGEMVLDVAAAKNALQTNIAAPLGKSVTEAAEGILRIAVTTMSYAVKGVTTERGLDAGNFTLVAYGGAGPLHATAVARELGIRTVVIPQAAGVFSSFGMLFSDLRYDFVRTRLMRLDHAKFEEINAIFAELESEGRAAVADASRTTHDVTIKRAVDMRYVGQEHAVTVDVPFDVFEAGDREAIKRLFDDTHDLRYGTCAPEEQAEIVSLRTTVTGVMRHPPIRHLEAGSSDPSVASTGTRKAYFDSLGEDIVTPTFDRMRLRAGNKISGPAFVEEHAATTVLLPGDHMQVDRLGNLVITVGERA
ncbi:MAG: hydantoinase/oxoprolinase family protein [Xanthobacteraceae bacterium]